MLLPAGTNINHALVKDGWCWWYWKYASKEYGISEAREECTRDEEKLVDGSDSYPVGQWRKRTR